MEEASRLLKGEDGGFKPFSKFFEDVRKIDDTYNRNYLNAEYNFAVGSTQMAVKWHEWESDGGSFDLQYRTAGDDRVREEHADLDGTTLPMDDPFWKSYLPPNGWNCRCTAVQVPKGKYPLSDSEKAQAAGANATSKPKQQIFRFNPGAQERIFPPKHPYFPKGCGNCQYKLGYNPNSSICTACVSIGKCMKSEGKQSAFTYNSDKEEYKKRRKQVKDQLGEQGNMSLNGDGFYTKHLHIGKSDIDCLLQHAFSSNELDAIGSIHSIITTLKNGSYSPINTSRKNYKEKMTKKGIRHFVKYDIEYEENHFELKCKAVKEKGIMKEYPYSLKEK